MSLQSRLSALITVIGADVKTFNTKFNSPPLVGFGQLEVHSTYTDFNLINSFGYHYVQGNTNGPGIPGGTEQYYSVSLSLGSEYNYSQYVYQIAYKRMVPGIFASRSREGGTWGPWAVSSNIKVADSNLLDGLDSTAFLRTDINTVLDGGSP